MRSYNEYTILVGSRITVYRSVVIIAAVKGVSRDLGGEA
jgi:hypothetical protein